MDKEKLNIKLGEWASIVHFGLKFTESLDACFKWLVPKLIELGYDVDLFAEDGYYFGRVRKTSALKWHICTIGYLEPALALCLAIEKKIDDEGK